MLFSNVMSFVNCLFYGCEHTPLKLSSLKQPSLDYYLKYYTWDMWTEHSGFGRPQLRMMSAWQDRVPGLPVQCVLKMWDFVYKLVRISTWWQQSAKKSTRPLEARGLPSDCWGGALPQSAPCCGSGASNMASALACPRIKGDSWKDTHSCRVMCLGPVLTVGWVSWFSSM